MKKILLLMVAVACLMGCSPKSKVESVIKEIYGTSVKPENTSDGLMYVMDFTDKKSSPDEEIGIKFKDKIDKALGITPEIKVLDVGRGKLSVSDLYHWDTPKIKVLLDSNREIINYGLENVNIKHSITIIIKDK